MTDIPSGQESDDLSLEGDDGGDDSANGAEPKPHQNVNAYDFKHPARVNRDQLRSLENLHDNFARLLSATFSGAVQEVVDVDIAFVDQTTYAEFIMSLSNPSLSYQFILGPTRGGVVLDIAMPIVFAAIDRIHGGPGSSDGIDARQPTPIEIATFNRIARRCFEDLEATWQPVCSVDITDIELETNPEFMQITAASEIVVLLAFEVSMPRATGLVSLCYPFFTLESLLPHLGTSEYQAPPRSEEDQDRMRCGNRLRLGAMKLPVRAELGRVPLSLAAARQLEVGDVLELNSSAADPVVVYLGDQPKYLGYPCISQQGHNSVKVAGPIPAVEQQQYRNGNG